MHPNRAAVTRRADFAQSPGRSASSDSKKSACLTSLDNQYSPRSESSQVSENEVIRSEEHLAQVFRQRLTNGALKLARDAGAAVSLDPKARGVSLELDGKAAAFDLKFRVNPGRRDIENLAQNTDPAPILLITVRLSQALVRHCRELGVSCADLNGRVWIRAQGILIDTSLAPAGVGAEYAIERKEPSLFAPKSSRLARVLIGCPGRAWKQSELVETTGLATGLVSRLLTHLVHVGWVTGHRGNWQLTEPDALLDAWQVADEWTKRVIIREYTTLEQDRSSIARRLADLAGHALAFTQWFAAGLRFPYADVPVVSAYRDAFLDDDELHALGATPVITGGRIWILLPKDDGVFQAGRQVQGLPLVSDVQIYLDLLHVGLRGPDQAKALRQWSGFCR